MTTVTVVTETAHFLRAAGADIFAVITEPTAPPSGAGVVIASGGRYGNTGGRNGVGRRLAHTLASQGFYVLRFDYHGVGDSTGSIEEFVLHEPFVADLNAAVAALRRHPVDRIGALGDCFGARTALAACAADSSISALLLVSLPWRDLARSDRKAHIVSSQLSVGDYARRGLRLGTVAKLRDPGYRRASKRLVRAKGRQVLRRVTDRVAHVDVEPWVSRRVMDQLTVVRHRGVATLLLYGNGPAEDYTHDFTRIRAMGAMSWLDDRSCSVQAQVLDQPIAGFRNVVSQDEVVCTAADWFAEALSPTRDPSSDPVGP